MVSQTAQFSQVSDDGEITLTNDSGGKKQGLSKRKKYFVTFSLLLMLIGLGCGLYFILRPHPVRESSPHLAIENKRRERALPCPKYPGMIGTYDSTSCSRQTNCKWVNFNQSLGLPFNCTYDTENTGAWKLSLQSSNSSSKSYSLEAGNRKLQLDIFCRTKNELRVKISDRQTQRFEVPDTAIPISQQSTSCSTADYSYSISEEARRFSLKRNNVTILTIPFDSGFVYEDQFLQVSLQLNSSTNYGFGEHNHKELKLNMTYRTWSIFTRDVAPVDNWNLYGAQPYFMSVSSLHKFVLGTFLKNSNAMDVHLQPDPYPSVTYRVIGGILDFHFFVDSDPESVTKHYTSLIGRPLLPPYWSLGFQLSRWGYQDTAHVRNVVERNRKAGIPLDVVYGDIDYMSNKLDFTIDTENFGDLSEYIDELRNQHNLSYVIILDPGIGIEENITKKLEGGQYKALIDGLNQDVFVKDSNNMNLVGEVWPGLVHYPDFTKPTTTTWWTQQIWDFYNNTRSVNDSGLRFDGLWVDMNEPSSFREGKKAEAVCDMKNKLNSPPYIPENLLGNSLVDKTICMDSQQEWGKHYNVHSLYGHSMAQSTYRSLLDLFPSKRPFVLTRSTFPGTSKYAIHWLGDNQSQWRQISWSIVSMLEYSLFGFSMTGSDICGFWYNTTESMCQRWMQLGAFYPFARNHNAGKDGNYLHVDQDPGNYGEAMIKSSRDILLTRYKLLPYLYTLMYQAHVTGSTVARPLFHEFMYDTETHTVDRQFLWGPALLISPCMEEGSEEVEAYIPDGIWYNYFTGVKTDVINKWTKLHTPLDKINLHVRGGYIIPWQTPDVNTKLSKNKPYGLLIALNHKGEAEGQLYLDDGDAAGAISNGEHSLVELRVSLGQLKTVTVKSGYKEALNLPLSTIQVFGVEVQPSQVSIDSDSVTDFTFVHDLYSKVLTINVADAAFTYNSNHTVTWTSI